jgi:hypothetical protein
MSTNLNKIYKTLKVILKLFSVLFNFLLFLTESGVLIVTNQKETKKVKMETYKIYQLEGKIIKICNILK